MPTESTIHPPCTCAPNKLHHFSIVLGPARARERDDDGMRRFGTSVCLAARGRRFAGDRFCVIRSQPRRDHHAASPLLQDTPHALADAQANTRRRLTLGPLRRARIILALTLNAFMTINLLSCVYVQQSPNWRRRVQSRKSSPKPNRLREYIYVYMYVVIKLYADASECSAVDDDGDDAVGVAYAAHWNCIECWYVIYSYFMRPMMHADIAVLLGHE